LSNFYQACVSKELVLTAELPLKPDASASTVITDAKSLLTHVDGILLTDNQYGQVHMSTMAAAGFLIDAGLDPIVQLSCRNRNRIALLGDLLGLRAMGVNSLMLVQGTKVPKNFQPRPAAVIDMKPRELIATAKLINEDEGLGRHEFLIVASGTIHDRKAVPQQEELLAKANAGARLIITQICFDIELLKRYIGDLVRRKLTHRLQIFVSLATPPSAAKAAFLRDNRRRALVPDAIIRRLEQSVDAEAEGVAIASELIQQYAEIPGVTGINLVPVDSLETAKSAIELSGVLGN
jgi:methylenetetrahydrofolate reductase (NADPH)